MDFHCLPATAGYGGALNFFVFLYWMIASRNRGRLPPGPHPLPIIGNLHQIKKPVHHGLRDLAEKYGPIMFLRLGYVPTVVVSSSLAAEHFLKTQDSIFASRPATAAGYATVSLWRLLEGSEEALRVGTVYLSENRVHEEEEVSAMTLSIWEQSQNGTIAVNVSKAVLTVACNVISRILFGRKISDDDLGGDGKGIKHMLLELSYTVGDLNIGDLQGIKRRAVETTKIYDALAEKMIDDHLNAAEAEAEHVKGGFVDVLIQIMTAADNNHIINKGDTKARRERVKSIMFDILVVGMETSAATLEWTMSELLRQPHLLKKLQEEIESTVGKAARKVSESDVGRMNFLQCVVKETLRLHPPVPLALPHESIQTTTVCGYNIPKKTMVIVNVWALGRDPNVWGEGALDFKPERFMHEVGEHDNIMYLVTSQSDFRMLPFSAGRRGCPAGNMAIPMLELALAQLLYCFD